MSRLATRIARLEQALPPCPACRSRRTAIELAMPVRPAPMSRAQFCPDCGERIERLTIALSFDPDRPVAATGAEAAT